MSTLLATLLRPLRAAAFNVQSITSPLAVVMPETLSLTSIRTKVRCYFPRPNEVKRVRTQGWQARISTPSGRRVIMRRMLKGRLVLTH